MYVFVCMIRVIFVKVLTFVHYKRWVGSSGDVCHNEVSDLYDLLYVIHAPVS